MPSSPLARSGIHRLPGELSNQDKQLFVVGGGGHAKVVIEVARSAGWDVVAVFDPGATEDVLGVPVFGGDDEIAAFVEKTGVRLAAIAIGNNNLRRRLALKIRAFGCETPAILHERSWVSPSCQIAQGVIVMAGAVINASAQIGEDAVINTMAIVEHDCVLGIGVHAAPRSVMGGTCHIGDGALFGIGATARPGITVGKDAIIGAGCVVVSDVAAGTTLVGNPGTALSSGKKKIESPV
jgi:UDP-perosamine 4-acetyltransferase